MNRHRYTEHRIRTSLERHVASLPVSDDQLRRLVDQARRNGVIVFLKSELDALAPVDRAIIEGAAERFAKGHR